MTEIQVSDLNTTTEIEDNDASDLRYLPKIPFASEDSDSGERDKTE